MQRHEMHRLMYRQCLMYRHMCLYMTHVSLTDTCLICVICVSVERHILMSHVCHYMSHTCLYITHEVAGFVLPHLGIYICMYICMCICDIFVRVSMYMYVTIQYI